MLALVGGDSPQEQARMDAVSALRALVTQSSNQLRSERVQSWRKWLEDNDMANVGVYLGRTLYWNHDGLNVHPDKKHTDRLLKELEGLKDMEIQDIFSALRIFNRFLFLASK